MHSATMALPLARTRSYPLLDMPFAVACLSVLGAILAVSLGIMWMNDGVFTYTLDDAYIHLSVSEQISRGNYGINNGEFSAPSSSILFPLLLAVAAPTPLHPYVALALNAAALLATLAIFRVFLLRAGFDTDRTTAMLSCVLIAAAALALNLIGVVFTGMEHSLHIALTAAIILGLVLFLEDDRVCWWFPTAIVAAPLVRYEGLALSTTAIVCLMFRGRWRTAVVAAALMVFALGAFSAFLIFHGLAPVPSSVLAKSRLAGSGFDEGSWRHVASALWANVKVSLALPVGRALVAAGAVGVAAVALTWRRRATRPDPWVGLTLSGVALGHVAAGQYGWFDRYEIYAVVGCAMMLVHLLRQRIRLALSMPVGRPVVLVGALAVLMMFGWHYRTSMSQILLAANNIYEQPYQTHRFLVDYYHGAAVLNDIGWSSYRNDDYVLDVVGLASDRMRKLLSERKLVWRDGKARMTGPLAPADSVVREKEIGVAVLFSDWFFNFPDPWIRVGRIYLSRDRASVGERDVDFYATGPQYVDRVRTALTAFAQSLPSRIRLDIEPGPR